jgi:hypothetical protein
MFYVNIATPAEWDSEILSAIDLDLDVIHRASEADVIIDDEDEFDRHITSFGYPADLITTCLAELANVVDAVSRREEPMSDEIFEWRLGDLLEEELVMGL